MKLRRLFAIVVVVIAVVLAIYFIADDTPSAWLVRLGYAGGIVAGLGFALYALADVVER